MPQPLATAKFLRSETDPSRLGPCAAEVTFVGRSNVGKSTLINAVCRKDLARVSKNPGCTRTINVFEVGRDRWLVDLPGYGFAAGPQAERNSWGTMIESYLTQRPGLRMVFVLVDAKVGPTDLDLMTLKWLEAKRLPYQVIATKSDQVKPSHAQSQRCRVAQALGLEAQDLAWVSAQEGLGLSALRGAVSELLNSKQ